MNISIKERIAGLPRVLTSEFMMSAPDEALLLLSGYFGIYANNELRGRLEGTLCLEWLPTLRLVVEGEHSEPALNLIAEQSVILRLPAANLELKAHIIKETLSQPFQIRALVSEGVREESVFAERFRFYLVNFPALNGTLVRSGDEEAPTLRALLEEVWVTFAPNLGARRVRPGGGRKDCWVRREAVSS